MPSCFAQVFFTESFETTSGWTLSHTYDDLDDDFCKRDSATNTAFPGLQYFLIGADGTFVVAAEDTDAAVTGAPTDGVVTLSLDPTSIAGMADLELVVSLSCNESDALYDDRSFSNGDFVDFQVNIDGGGWTTIAMFNASAGSNNNSTLYHDVDMDGDGGEVGELPVTEFMTDFVMPISGNGNSIEVRCVFQLNGGDEEIVFDEFRLRESQGDDVPPQVFSAELIDDVTLKITFSEDLDVANSLQPFHYSGVPDLGYVSSGPDNVIFLNYSTPFVLGEENNLVIFGILDAAGNQMPSPYNYTFYYNPTLPELVITEIMYNDPSEADTLEFIEIYNNGAAMANIGGFRLEEAINHTVPSGTIIPAGGFYLAARNAVSANLFYAETFDDYGGQFSDNSEQVNLRNAQGVMIDSVSYMDDIPWPPSADGDGPSMELAGPDLDNMVGANWIASTNGVGFVNGIATFATPGFIQTGVLPVVQVQSGDIEVWEGEGTITLNVFISASNSTSSVISISYLGGTAAIGDDHDLGNIPSVGLPANSSGMEQLVFPLYEDLLDEGVEYFTIGISAVSNCVTGADAEVTIIIADNDHTPDPLFINELQSDNFIDIADEAFEFDDWFEIYNPNSFPVDIAGYFVSDELNWKAKDRIPVGDPATIIPANGWMLLWADEDGSQGPLHVGFKLSGSGESIILTDQDSTQVIDQVTFGPLLEDTSFGRNGDGTTEWVVFEATTPGEMNVPLSVNEYSILNGVYPNPSNGMVFLPEPLDIRLYDATGKMVLAQQAARSIDLSVFDKGVFVLVTDDGRALRLVHD